MSKKSVLNKTDEEELLKTLEGKEKIEKEATLAWDGTNLLLRLPKEIADYFGVNKSNRFQKSIKFTVEEEKGEVKKEFDIIVRTKPKRQNGKKKTKKKTDNGNR